jgi:hypothetical protein
MGNFVRSFISHVQVSTFGRSAAPAAPTPLAVALWPKEGGGVLSSVVNWKNRTTNVDIHRSNVLAIRPGASRQRLPAIVPQWVP